MRKSLSDLLAITSFELLLLAVYGGGGGPATAAPRVIEAGGGGTNSPPEVRGAPSTTVLQGTPYSFAPIVTDPEGNSLRFTIANAPRWAIFDGTTGKLSGTPSSADVGNYDNIRISVSDGRTITALAPFHITVAAFAAGSITLNWLPPTENADGGPSENLGGYRVYWGTSEGNYSQSATLDNPGLATYVVDNLTPATWFFTVTALSTTGVEGPSSNSMSLTLN